MEEHWEIVGIHSKLPFLTTYIPQRIVWGGHNIIELIPGIGSCFGEGELKSGTAAISPTLTGTYFMGFVSPPTQRGREGGRERGCDFASGAIIVQGGNTCHLPFTIIPFAMINLLFTIKTLTSLPWKPVSTQTCTEQSDVSFLAIKFRKDVPFPAAEFLERNPCNFKYIHSLLGQHWENY